MGDDEFKKEIADRLEFAINKIREAERLESEAKKDVEYWKRQIEALKTIQGRLLFGMKATK